MTVLVWLATSDRGQVSRHALPILSNRMQRRLLRVASALTTLEPELGQVLQHKASAWPMQGTQGVAAASQPVSPVLTKLKTHPVQRAPDARLTRTAFRVQHSTAIVWPLRDTLGVDQTWLPVKLAHISRRLAQLSAPRAHQQLLKVSLQRLR